MCYLHVYLPIYKHINFKLNRDGTVHACNVHALYNLDQFMLHVQWVLLNAMPLVL